VKCKHPTITQHHHYNSIWYEQEGSVELPDEAAKKRHEEATRLLKENIIHLGRPEDHRGHHY